MASFAFRVEGIEPSFDPIWHLVDAPVRAAYWRAVVALTLEVKDAELAAGLDRFGLPLTPIAASTRARGRGRSHTGLGKAGNPPLTPANALSRTRALLTGRARDGHAEFFWTTDPVTGLHWGQVLGYHRDGAGRLPERDVIGLAPQSLAVVKARADRWWASYKAGHPVFDAEGRIGLPIGHGRPRLFERTGRIDIEHATFGIGGDLERARRTLGEGTTTGFRQLPPRRGPARFAPPRPPAPPRPVPIGRGPAPSARPAAPAPRPAPPARPRIVRSTAGGDAALAAARLRAEIDAFLK